MQLKGIVLVSIEVLLLTSADKRNLYIKQIFRQLKVIFFFRPEYFMLLELILPKIDQNENSLNKECS